MSLKTVSWIVVALIASGAVLLFNYWVAFQWLSMLAYAGIITAIFGLANIVVPFRFMGILRREVGTLTLAVGVVLSLTALSWPAPIFRVAHPATRLDEIMPEYQFREKHSARMHAGREPVMQAIRESTFGDMTSLNVLLRVRGAGVRDSRKEAAAFASDRRIVDAFEGSGYALGGNEQEVVLAGGANVRAGRPLQLRTLQEFADCRERGAVKMAFDFTVESAGDGWSTVTAETRVLALDESGQGMARYWRLIVPGSGMLRREWLDGIRRRAERG